MIQFEDIDKRLDALKLDRAWLAENTPYSADYLRTVLAPKSTRRTERVQQIINDAIEKEEERRLEHPKLPDRLTIECEPTERRKWSQAAASKGETLDAWIVEELNQAATACLGISAVTTPHHERPAAEKQG